MCRLFHKWPAWKDVKISEVTTYTGLFSQTTRTGKIIQRRHCLRCNLAQEHTP